MKLLKNNGADPKAEDKDGLKPKSMMKKKQKSFVCVRFSSKQATSKEEQQKHVAQVDKFIADIGVLTKASAPVTVIFTSVTGTTLHEKTNALGTGKVKRNRQGKRHLLSSKSPKRRRRLGSATYVEKDDMRRITESLPFSH